MLRAGLPLAVLGKRMAETRQFRQRTVAIGPSQGGGERISGLIVSPWVALAARCQISLLERPVARHHRHATVSSVSLRSLMGARHRARLCPGWTPPSSPPPPPPSSPSPPLQPPPPHLRCRCRRLGLITAAKLHGVVMRPATAQLRAQREARWVQQKEQWPSAGGSSGHAVSVAVAS